MANKIIRVLAGGCFNKIHPGHIYFLKKAKSLGKLFVVLTNDKNNRKPYAIPAKIRKKNMEKLKIADNIIIGDEKDFTKIVNKIKPSFIALGYDQKLPKDIWGFRIIKIPKHGRYSTRKALS